MPTKDMGEEPQMPKEETLFGSTEFKAGAWCMGGFIALMIMLSSSIYGIVDYTLAGLSGSILVKNWITPRWGPHEL